MNQQPTDLVEKLREQYNTAPYPRVPLEKSPIGDPNALYIHNLVTSYYLRDQQVIDPAGKMILDAGCGTGYKSLTLAVANPGAKVVGIDLSEVSVELAEQRLQHHGFSNAEFHAMSLLDLPRTGWQFDYINCDDVLYLLPDPIAGLQAMKAVLKPNGIIRANLHSMLQRFHFYRGQKIANMLGLMDEGPQQLEVDLMREFMQSLGNHVFLKQVAWKPEYEADDERIVVNYLLRGDKGFTIPEMFAALQAADLELISMVQWHSWNLSSLFSDSENVPVFISMALAEASWEDQLHLFELLQPSHRLLDFWCGHPDRPSSFIPVSEWTEEQWQQAQIHLHPQVRTPEAEADLINCIQQLRPFVISQHLPWHEQAVTIESGLAPVLLPLWQAPQLFTTLVDRWQQLRPLDPITMEPTSATTVSHQLAQVLMSLAGLGFVLPELPDN